MSEQNYENENESDSWEDSGEMEEEQPKDLNQMSRAALLSEITEIWQQKQRNKEKLIELTEEIEQKKEEIKEIRSKMAIESNQLNNMGNEILTIEN